MLQGANGILMQRWDQSTFQWNKPTKLPSLIKGSTNSMWALINLHGPIVYNFNADNSTLTVKGFSHEPLSHENFVFSYGLHAFVPSRFFISKHGQRNRRTVRRLFWRFSWMNASWMALNDIFNRWFGFFGSRSIHPLNFSAINRTLGVFWSSSYFWFDCSAATRSCFSFHLE
jgi:hypothetical protein